jgi:pleiotropic regulator 1
VGSSSTALARPARLVEEATGVLRVEVEEERTAVGRARDTQELLERLPMTATAAAASSSAAGAVVAYAGGQQSLVPTANLSARQMLIASKREIEDVRPEWHAPWKLMRVISAHAGWVRAIAVDHSNEWFATGSVDRTIKIFDLASGNLKLTLTGHISGIRGLAISKLTPYMFSIGEDKQVKCWDMEQNKVIRDYHAHLSGGYCCSLLENQGGPNILVTGGRDSVARVWDIRTTAEVAVLCGHTQTVASIQCQMGLPQVITGSHDTTIKLWDLRKTAAPISTLTHHKKSVRALQIHPTEYTFTSGAGDNIKVWRCPEGTFLRNISGHNATINALALNRENVLVSGADNGSLRWWDYKSGHCFQQHQTQPQPGSLDAESGIFAMTFDQTGSRLLTGETDKSIKVYKEDDQAVSDTSHNRASDQSREHSTGSAAACMGLSSRALMMRVIDVCASACVLDQTEETHPLTWRPGKRRKKF